MALTVELAASTKTAMEHAAKKVEHRFIRENIEDLSTVVDSRRSHGIVSVFD